ncbi:MAG: transglycosylase SLT domain-containing protein [Burkholderiales bacterium]
MNTSVALQFAEFRSGKAFSVVHNILAIVGVVALAISVVLVGRAANEAVDNRLIAFGQIRYAGNQLFEASPEVENQQYRSLANFLAKRYRVASDPLEHLVGATFEASRQVGIDPLLVLSVMAVESRFNPIAESEFGAKGLMQVIPKHHWDKVEELGGVQAMLDPMNNILIGARILKQYIRQSGSIESALQIYNGALADNTNQYAQKVIGEQERMRQAMRGNRQIARAPTL